MTSQLSAVVAVTAAVVSSLAVGCGDVGETGAAPTVRDSAGIRIVENVEPQWAEGEGWQLAEEPAVDIGGSEDDPDQQLFHVATALVLADRSIVIANGGTRELRFYDRDGAFLSASGGSGEGPGEFKMLGWLGRFAGDSLIAFDVMGRRASVFDAEGRFARSIPFEPSPGMVYPAPIGMFEDGTFPVKRGLWMLGGSGPSRIERPQEDVFRYAADGKASGKLGSFPSIEFYVGPTGSTRPSGDRVIAQNPRQFGRYTSYSVYRDRFYVADNATYEIKAYSPGGQLRSIVRKHHQHLDVTQEDLDLDLERRLRYMRDEVRRSRVERVFRERPKVSTMPAFGSPAMMAEAVRVDQVGNLWVLEYSRPSDHRLRWTVFDPDGRLLGTLQLPAGLRLLDIGDDCVLGLWRDELDVEHVRLYELSKPQ
ncbi:MAG: hypothetical protein GTN78_22390 [Gemmatimonadales bacterium]|nr:hypothetical protein [Gemmatimonadales bacterium]NIR02916.1 hypothetical protein [Gemmatimonadales bacterium]